MTRISLLFALLVVALTAPPAGAQTKYIAFGYDFGAGIDLNATDLLIDGEAVDASREGNQRRVDLRH